MEGTVGFANGEWHYAVKLPPVEGVAEVICVAGFKSERAALQALERASVIDLQNYARSKR